MKICSIIIVYNGCKEIIHCFKSIKDQVDFICLIDNNSNKETLRILNDIEKENKVKVIYNKENTGIARALNQGFQFAIEKKINWVLTLDQDSICHPRMVKELKIFYQSYTSKDKIAIISALDFHVDSNIRKYEINQKKIEGYEEKEIVITSGSLTKTEIFKIIGPFNEQLFIDSVDYDFCLRTREKNYKIIQVHSAKLFHSLGKQKIFKFFGKKIFIFTNHPPLRLYYIFRNSIYVFKKFDSPSLAKHKKWLLKVIIKIIIVEKQKFKKLYFIILGLYHGILKKMGEYNK